MRATAGPGIRLAGVTVVLGAVVALEDIDLELRAGEVSALVGVNGSGKSTLLGVLAGLIRPRVGSVDVPADVALVTQDAEGHRRLPISVRQTVMMGRWAVRGRLGRIRSSDHAIVQGRLERCGLAELADRQLGELSGGQRRRALVARALAQQSSVLLLDEPTAAADATSAEVIHRLLRTCAEEGDLVVVSSHDPAISGIADRTITLDQGRIVADVRRPGAACLTESARIPDAGHPVEADTDRDAGFSRRAAARR